MLKQAPEFESAIINVRDQDKVIGLPNLDGTTHEAKLNWIQCLEGPYYLAGLTYIGDSFKDPMTDGLTEWMLKIDKEVGFIPLFNAMYWEESK